MQIRKALAKLPAPSTAYFRIARIFFAAYGMMLAVVAYHFGLVDNWAGFDFNALLAGLYFFLAGKAHSRVKKRNGGSTLR